MMRKVVQLPGTNCTHYLRGHCLLEEWRNPGLHQEWKCKMLLEWEDAYDTFLTQAENFNLELGVATKIWERRLGNMMCAPSSCASYQPACTGCSPNGECGDAIACRHVWVDFCILALPVCSGICQNYEHKKNEDEEDYSENL